MQMFSGGFSKKFSMLSPKAWAWLAVTEFGGIFLKRDHLKAKCFLL